MELGGSGLFAGVGSAYNASHVGLAINVYGVAGTDTYKGDICEQEIVKIDYDLRPRDFYEQHILPALLRTLERALKGISNGNRQRIPQVENYSTYDKKA